MEGAIVNITVMLYGYLAVCLSVIFFNVAYVMTQRWGHGIFGPFDRKFEQKMYKAWNEGVNRKHQNYLLRKSKHLRYITAFERILSEMSEKDSEKTDVYIKSLNTVVCQCLLVAKKRDQLTAAYWAFFIGKHHLYREVEIPILTEKLLQMVTWGNVYSRENALQALYSIGNVKDVISGLKLLNSSKHLHNQKAVSDGLLGFSGDKKKLNQALWELLDSLQPWYQVAILNYLRFSTDTYCREMLELLTCPDKDIEVHLAAVRYLSRYFYPPAKETLQYLAVEKNTGRWELAAVACTALSSYPSSESETILKENLHSRNWYIRTNAADSLQRMGLDYFDLIDVIDGADRYAAEAVSYRMKRAN